MLDAWTTALESREAVVRLAAFALVFTAVALAESAAPRRALELGRRTRWPSNLAITATNAVVMRFAIPLTAVGTAALAQDHGVGVLNILAAPTWLAFSSSLLVLDLALYAQHRLFHAVPFLWRLHRVHHADLDVDITTGARFHPFEILLSLLIKVGVIAALGAPAAAVIVFEVVLNASSMFNHGNLELPLSLDRGLRTFLVTPDMHRIHHSVEPEETNSNFGFNLTWWDYLLSTYRSTPRAGHTNMVLGVADERDPKRCARLAAMLSMPFDRRVTTPADDSAAADRVR